MHRPQLYSLFYWLTRTMSKLEVCCATVKFGIFLKTNKNLNRVVDQCGTYNRAMKHNIIVWHLFEEKQKSYKGPTPVQCIQSCYESSHHCLASFWWQTKVLLGSYTSAVRTIMLWSVTSLFGIFFKTNENINRVVDQCSTYNHALWRYIILWHLFEDKKNLTRVIDQCSTHNYAMKHNIIVWHLFGDFFFFFFCV